MGKEGTPDRVGNDASVDEIEEAFALVSRPGFNRGQTLRAGVNLGLLDALADTSKSAEAVAEELDLDGASTYRLLRGLAHWDVVNEDENRAFSLTDAGDFFRTTHPNSLAPIVQLWWHPDRLAAWGHLEDIVRDGGPTGYEMEFGRALWEHKEQHPELGAAFDGSMTIFSQLAAPHVLQALEEDGLEQVTTVCDVGGGRGYLLSRLLATHETLTGTVLDLPEVVEDEDNLWAPKLDVDDRCRYVAGDMFEEVPLADAYLLKNVLHDWSDEDCIAILSTIRRDGPEDARLFIVERLLPPPGETNPAIMSDINMMAVAGGRERTEAEFRSLLDRAGWTHRKTIAPADSRYSIVEAVTE